MKRQSLRVELFPLKKEEILAYLDDKGILVNDYFKTYLAQSAYQVVEEQQECLVEIVSLVDMGFDREATAPQIGARNRFPLKLNSFKSNSIINVCLSRG